MKSFRFSLLFVFLGLSVLQLRATLDTALQMQTGNPSGATADASNHQHYLIQRAQYALDYADITGEPNWVSWDLTTGDVGTSGRSNNFSPDLTLPAGFYAVTDQDYNGVGNINFNRGHMCPSEDRTVTAADNQVLFLMTNIVPQAADNNQGPWVAFETYCRSLAASGNEILIISGPSGLTPGSLIPSGKAWIAANVWKIAVVVPLGSGSALSRINASTRVIALKLPNVNGIRSTPWQNYVTTVNQIQADTGLVFFSALPESVATVLRAVTDAASTVGAPAIATQPAARSAAVGGVVTFAVIATGNTPLTYQWSKDGTPISGATASTLTLVDVQAAAVGGYSVVVSNTVGSVVSVTAALTVGTSSPGPAPIYWDFGAALPTSGLPAESSISDGGLVAGNNNGTTTLLTVTSVSGGYPGASGGNNAGAAGRTGNLVQGANGSAYFEFTLTAAAGRQLWATAISFGSRSTATGPQAFGIYTSVDNFSIPVASGTLNNDSAWSLRSPALKPVAGPMSGSVTYRIYGYNGTGAAAASTANWRIDDLSISVAAVGAIPESNTRLINLSSRARVGNADQAAFAGFTISGQGSNSFLVRAVGPALAAFGLPAPLGQPKLDLLQGSTLRGTNTGWTTGGNSVAIAAAGTASGAFPLLAASADSALLITLTPGSFTAISSPADGRSGVGLMEIYAVPVNDATTRLTNISTRAPVGIGADVLIAGFVIAGDLPERVLIRAAGPALVPFGVPGTLSRPQLTLFSGNIAVAQNSGWAGSSDAAAIAQAATRTGAFPFPNGSQDAALIVTLAAGTYSAQVTTLDGTSGIALVEIYELP